MEKLFGKRRNVLLMCFLTPAVILLITYVICGVAPFGDNSIAIADANIQYVDFFRYYRHIFQGTASVSYSFTNFLGDSGIALFAYYLASPFNLLILLFKEGQEHLVFNIIVLLKLSTAGLTAGIYLDRRFPSLRKMFVVILAASYALCQYSIAQSGNIMWLDGVYMLPIILLGLYGLMNHIFSPLFSISVGIAVLFNWYAGYFDCIGAAMFFFAELFLGNYVFSFKDTLIRFGSALVHGLVGVALAAALFLPSINALMGGKGQSEMSFEFSFTGNILSAFSGFAIGSASSKNQVALYCGCLVFLALGIYFTSRAYGWRDKVKTGIISLGFLMLVYFQPLEYIANGFRDITSYWVRYSYIIIAFCIFVAARLLTKFDSITEKNVLVVTFAETALLLAAQFYVPNSSLMLVIITCLFLVAFAFIFCAYKEGRKWFKKVGAASLAAIFIGDLGINAVVTFRHQGFSSVSAYQTYSDSRTLAISSVTENDTGFYRIAQEDYRYISDENLTSYYDDAYAYNYAGIAHYSSTYSNIQSGLMIKLGYAADLTVSVTNTRLLAADALLSVKYYVSEDGVKENKYFINPALVYSSEVTAVYDGDPFEYVNQLYSELLGEKVTVYEKQDIKYALIDNVLSFNAPKLEKNEQLLFALNTNGWTTGRVSCNDEFVSVYSYWLTPQTLILPGSTSSETTVRYDFAGSKDDINDVYCYTLNTKTLEKVVNKINKKAAATVKVEDGSATVVADADEDGMMLFLSIPVSDGWEITRNGEEVEIGTFAGTFYSIPLEKGENVIEMEYHTPYLKQGIAVSVVTALLLAGYAVIYEKKLKKGKAT